MILGEKPKKSERNWKPKEPCQLMIENELILLMIYKKLYCFLSRTSMILFFD